VLTTLLLLLGCIRGLVIESDARVVYPHTKARFGVDYGDTSYVGRLVKVEPFHACSPITTNLTGLIGLAIRDTSIENCTFVVKVLNIQHAGAIGAVIMNQKPLRWEGEMLSIMNNATEISEDVTIPSVFTGYQSGQSILQALQQFEVTATISSEGQVTNPSMSFLSLIGIFFLMMIMIYVCFLLVCILLFYSEKAMLQRLSDSPSSIVEGVYGEDGREIDPENPEECTICLDTLKKGEAIKTLPCKHIFHQNCIDEWLKQGKAVCPMCRRGIFDDDEVNWYLEGKAKDTDRIVAKWENVYAGSFSYLYSILFLVFVFFSPAFVFALSL
ncbi:hypothetical protein WA171_006238, partial [Blastocystis sp. BT1]